ncbi:pyridoxal phosphate-dependent aminotransferase [Pelotomaculum isophthalicicum JI]|uniref:Pyridoxal phosphate-dependent aminotransferase n=1 Tax=Pelotomaculum isophthalicicum JI TaxID=947010 RepID=A0A9X4GY23_9FIRM|nr:pyridoxal phosphate-dependent aminotransferase [Pelotomaculum isophthalicicum]MDF9407342.1 pyridoxal phosphate-dependent aminotransferase [Pelotomaculum isophthalicicum JI]
MTISKKINTLLTNASFIRKMFEEGERLRKQFGDENVYDFSLGNPDVEPPKAFKEALKKIALEPITGMHRYMSNAGYPETRRAVAEALAEQCGLSFKENHIVMTCGAGGALNVVLKTILDPGDEVIILSPFFVEYKFYIDNHGGVFKEVKTTDEFELDLNAINTAISANTKAIIINTPNNPTGVVYGAGSLADLGKLLETKEKEIGHAVFVISDEPYAKITYDGTTVPSVFKYIKNSVVVTSHSKDLALPGERIGYAAISPKIDQADLLMEGLVFCNRTLGFVNAPALMQHLVAGLQHESVNIAEYQEKRDLLYDNLTAMGFKMIKPQGAFYLFPQSPVKDDVEFVRIAQKHNILVVPGSGFGTPGYFRIAYCVSKQIILRSLPAFQALAKELGIHP